MRVWLTAPAEVLRDRMATDSERAASRPALRGGSALAEIEVVLAEREPLYAELATERVDTGGLSVSQVADAVLALLGRE